MSAIIDTHIHLDFSEFQSDLEQVLLESKQSGVSQFIIPGASIETLENALHIADSYKEVYYAIGIHPYHIDEILDSNSSQISYKQDLLQQLKLYINAPKCKAIGECGLDFFRLGENANKEIAEQIACFEMQIELALTHNLPLILHVRDSKEDFNASNKVAEILRKYQKHHGKNLRGVFHCYNACDVLLEFSQTFYYGIGGILTFKNAKDLTEILPKIPHDRILLETDAPYLAPIPYRGKRNESKFLSFVVAKMSEILQIPQQEICNFTTQNAQRLFNLT